MSNATIQQQMILIEEEMKAAGFWSDAAPEWVLQYQSNAIPNIWQWLQFVYIPLRIKGNLRPSVYLAPQVTAHTGVTLSEESLLLQRIVELDSLTPMLPQS
jgi:uncharacterized protein YqcC (DUF446 family)